MRPSHHSYSCRVNTWLLRQLAEVRTPWLTDVATGIKAAGTAWGIAVGVSQLRAHLKRDPRDLLGEFRALAPPRQPIVMQRWGARRVMVTAAMLAAAVAALGLASNAFRPVVNLGSGPPVCGTGHAMILSAQVRVPAEVHRRLVREAAEQHVSLNRLVSDRLARA